jgi:hypothetical protein
MFSDGRDWRRDGPADTGRIWNKLMMCRRHNVLAAAETLCLLLYIHVPILLPMGRACSLDGGGERHIQGFDGET